MIVAGRKVYQFGVANRRPSDLRPGNSYKPRVYHRVKPDETREPGSRSQSLARLEAVLFQAESSLTTKQLASKLGLETYALKTLIDELKELYKSEDSPFKIVEIAGGLQLRTRSEFHPWLNRVIAKVERVELTPALLETLSIVAYKQPITRADVDAIRGVASSEYLRLLMEKRLVRTAGRHDSLGRPQLYATTKKFLQQFGLASIEDLPAVAELTPPKSGK